MGTDLGKYTAEKGVAVGSVKNEAADQRFQSFNTNAGMMGGDSAKALQEGAAKLGAGVSDFAGMLAQEADDESRMEVMKMDASRGAEIAELDNEMESNWKGVNSSGASKYYQERLAGINSKYSSEGLTTMRGALWDHDKATSTTANTTRIKQFERTEYITGMGELTKSRNLSKTSEAESNYSNLNIVGKNGNAIETGIRSQGVLEGKTPEQIDAMVDAGKGAYINQVIGAALNNKDSAVARVLMATNEDTLKAAGLYDDVKKVLSESAVLEVGERKAANAYTNGDNVVEAIDRVRKSGGTQEEIDEGIKRVKDRHSTYIAGQAQADKANRTRAEKLVADEGIHPDDMPVDVRSSLTARDKAALGAQHDRKKYRDLNGREKPSDQNFITTVLGEFVDEDKLLEKYPDLKSFSSYIKGHMNEADRTKWEERYYAVAVKENRDAVKDAEKDAKFTSAKQSFDRTDHHLIQAGLLKPDKGDRTDKALIAQDAVRDIVRKQVAEREATMGGKKLGPNEIDDIARMTVIEYGLKGEYTQTSGPGSLVNYRIKADKFTATRQRAEDFRPIIVGQEDKIIEAVGLDSRERLDAIIAELTRRNKPITVNEIRKVWSTQ